MIDNSASHCIPIMKTIGIIILAFGVIVATAKFPHESRILKGKNAQIGQFPYQVSLHKSDGNKHFCGASILSDRFLLTAGHCMNRIIDPTEIYAILGTIYREFGGKRVDIDKITIHEDFNITITINDITLLRTVQKIKFSHTVRPIALPKENLPPEGNAYVVVTGWGKDKATDRYIDCNQN